MCSAYEENTHVGGQGWNAMSPYPANVYVAILTLKDDGIRWNL